MTMNLFAAILAVLSIWDYPARQPQHERLRDQFVLAVRRGKTADMEAICRSGVKLLPDDPTWHFNLACALAYFPKRKNEALDELELAIDLGFRNPEAIAADTDLKRLSSEKRFKELVEYAKYMRPRPMISGPLSTVDATGVFGSVVALGEQNLMWDFDVGCFIARLKLAEGGADRWTGDLYMNRDGGHSPKGPEAKKKFLSEFPGITEVKFDPDGQGRGLDLNVPNVIFPYPTFGNSSMAFVQKPFWRSIPRAILTTEVNRLKAMERLYLSNQVWVFPSNADTPPVGTNGDVFASIAPYWLTTAGRSWSDLPYLRASLLASASLRKEVKREAVRRGLLAPTIMTLLRKSLRGVSSEDEYTSVRAHPTAMPRDGVDTNRLMKAAAELQVSAIPPIVPITVEVQPPQEAPPLPELTYRSSCAWAYVLRSGDVERVFTIRATGAAEYRFVKTHGADVDVRIEPVGADAARVTIDRTRMSPVNRVDIAVFGRADGTGWGAPSYVSFARMDRSAPYSDPALTPPAGLKPVSGKGR